MNNSRSDIWEKAQRYRTDQPTMSPEILESQPQSEVAIEKRSPIWEKAQQYKVENSGIDFPKFTFVDQVKDYAKEKVRTTSGKVARGLESALGVVGNTRNAFNAIMSKAIGSTVEAITGKEQPELRKAIADPLSAIPKEYQSAFKMANPVYNFPSSEDIKEKVTKPLSKKLTGDEKYTEPKSGQEEFEQDIVSTLSTPGAPGYAFSRAAVMAAFGGAGVKQLAKILGFEPSTAEKIKMGTEIVLSLTGRSNAPQYANNLYQQTKSEIPRGMSVVSRPLENALTQLENQQWYRGAHIPQTMPARNMISAIRERIQNGRIDAQDLITLKENANAMKKNLGGFNIGFGGRKAAVRHLDEVISATYQGLEGTLGRTSPRWYSRFRAANDAVAVTGRSSALADFIQTHYNKPLVSEAGKILFHNVLPKTGAAIAKGAMAAGSAAALMTFFKTGRRAMNPTLRRYYGNIIQAAAEEDAYKLIKNMDRFDKLAQQEEKKRKFNRAHDLRLKTYERSLR